MRIFVGPAGVPISCPKKDTISGIKCVYNLGLNLMEVQFVRGVKMTEEMAQEAGKIAKELGVRLSIHAPYYINLASERPDVLEKSINEWLFKSIKLASIMGARCVVFHPATYGKRTPEETFEIVKNSLSRLLELVKEYDVFICPETTGKSGQFGTVDELIKLAIEMDNERIYPCIDFAHIHARGIGSIKTQEAFEEILGKYYDFVSEYRPFKYLHIHFSSIEYTEKGEKAHLPIEAKEPDFELFVEALKRFNFDEVEIVSESPILEQDAIKMRDILIREGLMEPIIVKKPVEIVKRKRKKASGEKQSKKQTKQKRSKSRSKKKTAPKS